MLGNPGQPTTYRPVPEPDEPDLAPNAPPEAPNSLPGSCIRFLGSFRPECPLDCPGRQRDQGCLATLTRDAAGRGVRLRLEIDPDGYWMPVGEESL